MRSACWPLGLVLLAAASWVDARVVFDNGAVVDTATASDVSLPNLVADDFVLQPGDTTFNRILWKGVYASGNSPTEPDGFTIEIFRDDAGAPDDGAPLHTWAVGQPTRVDTGSDLGGFDIYAYSADIAALTLSPGADWWISIVNDTIGDSDDDWFWVGQGKTGNAHERTGAQFEWSSSFPFTADFALTIEVPEPSALLLIGLGLAGLGVARGRCS